MRTTQALATGVTVLALGVAGCGAGSSSGGGQAAKPVNPNTAEVNPAGDIPDNQAYVAYSPPGGGFSVKVPEGWGRAAAGGTVTFTDKLNSIVMETRAARAPLSVARIRATELPQLSQSAKGFQLGDVTQVSRKAGKAIRVTYLTDGRPDAVTGKVTREAVERYVFAQKGKEVVLTLSGPKGADNVDPWKIVTDSLRWKA